MGALTLTPEAAANYAAYDKRNRDAAILRAMAAAGLTYDQWAQIAAAQASGQLPMDVTNTTGDARLQADVSRAASNQAYMLGRAQLGQTASQDAWTRTMDAAKMAGNPQNIVSYLDLLGRSNTPVPLNNPVLTNITPMMPTPTMPGDAQLQDWLSGKNPMAYAGGTPKMAMLGGPKVLMDASTGKIDATLNENGGEAIQPTGDGGLKVDPGKKKTLGRYRQAKILKQAQKNEPKALAAGGTMPLGSPVAGPPQTQEPAATVPQTGLGLPHQSILDVSRSVKGTGDSPMHPHTILDYARLVRAGATPDQLNQLMNNDPYRRVQLGALGSPVSGPPTVPLGPAQGPITGLPIVYQPPPATVPVGWQPPLPMPTEVPQRRTPPSALGLGGYRTRGLGNVPAFAGGGYFGFDTPEQAMAFANATKGASASDLQYMRDAANAQALRTVDPNTPMQPGVTINNVRYAGTGTAGQEANAWDPSLRVNGNVAPAGYGGDTAAYRADVAASKQPRTNSWWGQDGRMHTASYDAGNPWTTQTGGAAPAGTPPAGTPTLGQAINTGSQNPTLGTNTSQSAAAKLVANIRNNTLIPPEFIATLDAGKVPGLTISMRAFKSLPVTQQQALTGLWISSGQATDANEINDQLLKNEPA